MIASVVMLGVTGGTANFAISGRELAEYASARKSHRGLVNSAAETEEQAKSSRECCGIVSIEFWQGLTAMFKKLFAMILTAVLVCSSADTSWAVQEPANPFPDNTQNPQEEQPKKDDPIVIKVDQSNQTPPNALPSETIPAEPDQKIVVKEKFAGWKEAGQGVNGESVVDQLRANWVMIGPNGLLTGQIQGGQNVNTAKVPVYILNRGIIVDQTRSDDTGRFSFNNIQQGTYSLVAFGDDAFFVFGFNALDYVPTLAANMPLELNVQAVENKTTINLDWIRFYAPVVKFRVYGRFLSKQGTEDPAWLLGLEGLSVLGPDSIPATTVGNVHVNTTASGSLLGRIHQIDELNGRPVDVRNMRALLIQNDQVVGAAAADNYGVFEISNVSLGEYSLVAVGADGMGCVGINVVGPSPDGAARAADISLASPETVGWLNHMATETAYQRIAGRKRTDDESKRCNMCGMPVTGIPCGNCGCMDPCGDTCGWNNGCGGWNGGWGNGYYGGGGNGNFANNTKQFWRDVNAFFDVLFYGETFAYSNPQGNGNYGGQYPYGYGNGYGNYGCNQCAPGAGGYPYGQGYGPGYGGYGPAYGPAYGPVQALPGNVVPHPVGPQLQGPQN